MKRQDYNKEIINHLNNRKFFENFFNEEMSVKIYETLEDCIMDYPDQRFGQIFTNYIYPDYRLRTEESLNHIMDMLFYNVKMDPFYEESSETYHRLVPQNSHENEN